MQKQMTWLSLAAAVLVALPAARAAAWDPEEAKKEDREYEESLADFKKTEPRLKVYFENAYGYALFPTVGKGGFVVGATYGKGRVYVGGKLVGTSTLSQGSVGATVGYEAFGEIVFFSNKAAFEEFKNGHAKFAAKASAYAIKAGAGTTADYDNGVAVFVKGKGGLMADASIGGQGFTYEPVK